MMMMAESRSTRLNSDFCKCDLHRSITALFEDLPVRNQLRTERQFDLEPAALGALGLVPGAARLATLVVRLEGNSDLVR